MEEIIGVLNDIVWSNALIVLWLAGLYFSVRTRFLQVRHIKNVSFTDGKSSESEFLLFKLIYVFSRRLVQVILQVLLQLSFWWTWSYVWMWMVAFLGASTAFHRSNFGTIYKEKHLGSFIGGLY
jgi:AGCS family alanine or glycine:cation symporter